MRWLRRLVDCDGLPMQLGRFYVKPDGYLVQAIRYTPFPVLIGPGLVGRQVVVRSVLLKPTKEPSIMSGAFGTVRGITASKLKRHRMRRAR